MDITTKLNIGDTAFTWHKGQILSGPIQAIDTHTTFQGKTRISYVIGGSPQSPGTYGRDEHEVFGSEQELITSSREVMS